MYRPRPIEKVIKELARNIGRCRRAEARPRSLARVRRQRELRDEQETSANRTEGSIHPAFTIRKHAISQHTLEEPVRRGLVIASGHPDQGQDAALNGAADPVPNTYF